MNDQGWEARMAARAMERARTALPEQRHVDPREREEIAQRRRTVASLTLGDAVSMLSYGPIPCACSGGAWCCIYRYPQAEALQRGAHIVARQLADIAHREAAP